MCLASKRQQQFELHVCTNKTCKKQGSKEVNALHTSQAVVLLNIIAGSTYCKCNFAVDVVPCANRRAPD